MARLDGVKDVTLKPKEAKTGELSWSASEDVLVNLGDGQWVTCRATIKIVAKGSKGWPQPTP